MELSNCKDDLHELLFFLGLTIVAEVFLFITMSWNAVVIIVLMIMNIFLLYDFAMSWYYLNRTIILDEYGCTFVFQRSKEHFTWNEIYVQQTENTSFLFADSEIPGRGVILSTKPLSKRKNIGALTYCRYTNPRTSVFIRFRSSNDGIKKAAAKYVYQGFTANENDILPFIEARYM